MFYPLTPTVMKKLLISLLINACCQSMVMGQFCGIKTYGLRVGGPDAPTGISFTRVIDDRNAFEWQLGYNGLWNRSDKTIVTITNERGQPETQTVLPTGYRNALILGGAFQIGLLQGNPRGYGQSLYLSVGIRGRMHLDRPTFQFDGDKGHWLTPELAVGPGFQVGLGHHVELFVDAHAVYFNPEDALVSTGEATNYVLGLELGGGLRYRIEGCKRPRRR
jgi:hypothetical protein